MTLATAIEPVPVKIPHIGLSLPFNNAAWFSTAELHSPSTPRHVQIHKSCIIGPSNNLSGSLELILSSCIQDTRNALGFVELTYLDL